MSLHSLIAQIARERVVAPGQRGDGLAARPPRQRLCTGRGPRAIIMSVCLSLWLGLPQFEYTVLAAQATVAQLPRIRDLGPREGTIVLPRESVPGLYVLSAPSVRELPDRRILVSDRVARQLLLFDSTLKKARVILDSGAADPTHRFVARDPIQRMNEWSHGRISPFERDQTLFIDGVAQSYIVIGPDGSKVAVQAAPNTPSVRLDRAAAVDSRGRGVQRVEPPVGSSNGFFYQVPPDSQPLIRAALGEPPDTLGWLRVPPRTTKMGVANPLPVNDDWALLSDGSVAVVRATDLHMDWVEPDGSRRSTPRIPFDWVRLSDEQKQALVDSLHAHYVLHPITDTYAGGAHGPIDVPEIISATALPDYVPPFGGYTAIGDAEQHLWIRIFTAGEYPNSLRPGNDSGVTAPKMLSDVGYGVSLRPPTGSPVYYVIDKSGTVVDRVRVPAGLRIVGFGRGSVYLLGDRSATEEVSRVSIR